MSQISGAHLRSMWRAGLPALGCEAALKSATSLCQAERSHRFYDCFAAERGQARSPQGSVEHEQRIIAELRFKAIGRHRPAEQVTLHFVATVLAQEVELLVGFHAFGEHRQVQP